MGSGFQDAHDRILCTSFIYLIDLQPHYPILLSHITHCINWWLNRRSWGAQMILPTSEEPSPRLSHHPQRQQDQCTWPGKCQAYPGIHIMMVYLVGGIPTPLKNMRQLGWFFPIYVKITHVPNHQPVMHVSSYFLPFDPTRNSEKSEIFHLTVPDWRSFQLHTVLSWLDSNPTIRRSCFQTHMGDTGMMQSQIWFKTWSIKIFFSSTEFKYESDNIVVKQTTF